MTLLEMKRKVLSLIEELNPGHPALTGDADISAKLVEVINQVLFELARMKKLPLYLEFRVEPGQLVDLAAIREKCMREVYQIALVTGVKHLVRAGGTALKALEGGTMGIDCFLYPRRVKEDEEEVDLPLDALEIMPYGVAADLLKSDPSANYGRVYQQRYEYMLQRLDPRHHLGGIWVEGGVAL